MRYEFLDDPIYGGLLAGLQTDNGELLILPVLAWSLVEASRTCYPFISEIYFLALGYWKEFGFQGLLSGISHEEEEEIIDPHAKIYSSFLDDRQASSNLDDVEKIKRRGYNKYRYVSTAFIKRNNLISNSNSNKSNKISDTSSRTNTSKSRSSKRKKRIKS